MTRLSRLARAPILLAFPALLLLAGCGGSTGGAGSPGTTAVVPTATATSAPTATTAPTTCAQLPGFSAAIPVNVPNTEFPAGTVGTAPTTSAGGTGQFTISAFDGCTPNNTTSLIASTGKGPEPFTSLLPFYGWATSQTFPSNGSVQQSCGSAKCFVYSDGTRYLALENVTDHGHGLITFHIRQATPPPAPNCNASIFTDPSYVTSTDGGSSGVTIPLPPLTRAGMGDGHAGSTTLPFCSAGTVASISAFLQSALPAYGWQADPADGANWWKQTTSAGTWKLSIQSLTDPTNWALNIYRPM